MGDFLDLVRFKTLIVEDFPSPTSENGEIPTRRVAACACLRNPLFDVDHSASLDPLVDASIAIGEMLVTRAVAGIGEQDITGYGKAALTGTGGDPKHGAAMIHVRLDGPMRRGAGGGQALIPGNSKRGAAGTSIDLVFSGLDDSWNYDAMDAMTVMVPDGPRPDEILLIVGYAAGSRPGARVQGASQDQVASLVQEIRGGT